MLLCARVVAVGWWEGPDPGCILKAEQTGSASGLDEECERKRNR